MGGDIVRFLRSMALVSALVSSTAIAENKEVLRGPPPEWVVQSELLPVPADASGLVFVRRQDTLVHLDRHGQSQYFGHRIKILHANALQLGNLSIDWNSAAGAPTVHAIKVYRDNEVIDVLKTASFEILRRESQLEAASLNGILTAVLRITDLRVGDELEFGLTTLFRDPTLGQNNSGLLLLGPNPSPGRFRMALSWAEGRQPKIKISNDLATTAQKGERIVEFRFDNPALLAPPKDAPPRFQWQRYVEYTGFADWAAVSRYFAPIFAKSAKLPATSPLKLEANRIATAHGTLFDRASAALKLVQQDVRYIYVGLDGKNLTPASADETWRRRYGDCKGKTAMLLALLAELGVEAEPILASNAGIDDGLDERLPRPEMFDHVLVRARINGGLYYLDGTLPPVVLPSVEPTLPYRWILPLTLQGTSIEPLEWHPSKTPDEITMFEFDSRAGFDKPAKITSTTVMRGIKGLQQQVQLSGMAPGELLNGMRQRLIGDLWQTIHDVKWQYDQKARASVLTISGTGTVDWKDDGDGTKSLSLPGGGFSPPEKRVRAAEQKQGLPFYNEPAFNCHVTTVRVPEGTQAKHWSLAPTYDVRLFGRNFYRAFELRAGAIRMVRGSRIEQLEIDATTAQKDNGRIAAFDNSMAWVTYDPDTANAEARPGKPVPATFDIDWTADNVPCRSTEKTD